MTNLAKYSGSGGKGTKQTEQQVSFESLHSFDPIPKEVNSLVHINERKSRSVRRQLS
jgi:hypothetical protein